MDKAIPEEDSVANFIALDCLKRAFGHLADCMARVDAELAEAALDDIAKDCADRLTQFRNETAERIGTNDPILVKAAAQLRDTINDAKRRRR